MTTPSPSQPESQPPSSHDQLSDVRSVVDEPPSQGPETEPEATKAQAQTNQESGETGPAVHKACTEGGIVAQVIEVRRWPQVPGYEIVEELGRGGMGVVYKARQITLNRFVAIKMIRGAAHADKDTKRRFLREAEMEARLRHPHFVQVHEVGIHDECPFFSMEWIEGGNLADKLKRPIPVHQATQWTLSLAKAVQHAHTQGIVHRDLKPANVLVDPEGMLKITDFGLAKHLSDEGTLTQTGAVMGTPAYMAPEQAEGRTKELGPAVDIYALGAILYEMLTGRPPFTGEDAASIRLDVIGKEPVSPASIRPMLPRDVETICLKCLEKDPARRYGSAGELADDLHRFLHNEPVHARRSGVVHRAVKFGRRRPVLAGGLFILLLLLLGGSAFGLWYWNGYLRIRTDYYADFVYRWGDVEGAGPLTEDQVHHRQASLKFYRRAGKVLAYEVVDARGQPTIHHVVTTWLGTLGADGQAHPLVRIDFSRDAEGHVTEQVARDNQGQVVWIFHYDSPETAHYSDRHGYIRAASGSGAAFVEFTWAADGFLAAIRYTDPNRHPQAGPDGSFGARFVNDAQGLAVRQTLLGPDGQACACKEGYTSVLNDRDPMGNITETTYLDEHDQPTLTRQGYARVRYAYDPNGNETEAVYFGTKDEPVVGKDGYARTTFVPDEHGNITEVRYFDSAGKPALCVDGYAGYIAGFDAAGNVTRLVLFDANGHATRNRQGVATYHAAYDERGNLVKVQYLDPDGKPTLHTDGNSGLSRAYDADSHPVEVDYLGRDGQPTPCRDGYAKLRLDYDSNGQLVRQAYFDVHDRPTIYKQGYASVRRTYDDRGNIKTVTYLDRRNYPTPSVEGFARIRREYDVRGRLSAEAYDGRQGQPVRCKSGYARFTAEYDDRGNRIREDYFDEQGRRIRCKEGYAWYVKSYDARGNITSWSYFGPDGKPTPHKDGNVRFEAKYDSRGYRTEETYLDARGKLVMVHSGCAGWTAQYDGQGNRVELAYFDVHRQPIAPKEYGYARLAAKYDRHGHISDVSYFDPKGHLTETIQGFARAAASYDDRGNRTELAYYDRHNRPTYGWCKETRKYDSWGREVELMYRDAADHLVPNDYGIARAVSKYDERGNPTEKDFFDRNNKPRADWAVERRYYDDQSRLIEVDCYNGKGHLTMTSFGFARRTLKYDDRGNQIEQRFFDQSGGLRAGWAKLRESYDDRNNRIESRYLTAGDQPALYKNGYARAKFSYDDYGNCVDVQYFDVRNKPVRTYMVIRIVKAGWQGQAKGLKPRDVVETYDGKPVFSTVQFNHMREQEQAGDAPRILVVRRHGERVRISIEPGKLGLDSDDKVVTATPPGR